MIKKFIEWLYPEFKKGKRLKLLMVSYSAAEQLIKEGWTLAPEEDDNRTIGMVYLELLEKK